LTAFFETPERNTHPHRLSREEKGREGKRCEEMRGREEKRREEKRREEKRREVKRKKRSAVKVHQQFPANRRKKHNSKALQRQDKTRMTLGRT